MTYEYDVTREVTRESSAFTRITITLILLQNRKWRQNAGRPKLPRRSSISISGIQNAASSPNGTARSEEANDERMPRKRLECIGPPPSPSLRDCYYWHRSALSPADRRIAYPGLRPEFHLEFISQSPTHLVPSFAFVCVGRRERTCRTQNNPVS